MSLPSLCCTGMHTAGAQLLSNCKGRAPVLQKLVGRCIIRKHWDCVRHAGRWYNLNANTLWQDAIMHLFAHGIKSNKTKKREAPLEQKKGETFSLLSPLPPCYKFHTNKILWTLKLKINDTEAKAGFLPFRTLRLSVEAACFSVCSACSRRLVSNSSASCNFLFAFFSFFNLF